MSCRVYLRYVEDGTVGCRSMVKTGLDGSDKHARCVWVGLLGEKDEDVLGV